MATKADQKTPQPHAKPFVIGAHEPITAPQDGALDYAADLVDDDGTNTSATPAPFDWSAIAAPMVMPSKISVSGAKVDVLTLVPEPIRIRAEASLAINVARVAKSKTSTADRPRPEYDWRVQPVTDTKMGQAFRDLITKYAKYRPSGKAIPHADPTSPKGQVTARTGDVAYYRATADGDIENSAKGEDGAFLGVRYSVRPFEQRGAASRLPGTT